MKITSDDIYFLDKKEIFVFGSNEAGRHGGGAARQAHKCFGAIYGNGVGLQGQTYAIPTKDFNIKTLPVEAIKKYVDTFLETVVSHPALNFLVTKIGCGLAGYTAKDIALLFVKAISIENISLPQEFVNIIEGTK